MTRGLSSTTARSGRGPLPGSLLAKGWFAQERLAPTPFARGFLTNAWFLTVSLLPFLAGCGLSQDFLTPNPPPGPAREAGLPDASGGGMDGSVGDGSPDSMPPACIPEAETCNGADDDCDEQVDEEGVCNQPPCPGGRCRTAFAAVSAGGDHTCAISTDGHAMCWGEGGDGRLGTGSEARQPEPTFVLGFNNEPRFLATEIAAGGAHTCALGMGDLYCWGDNDDGQLGTSSGSADIPQRVPRGSAAPLLGLSAGLEHTCAFNEQALFCFGENDDQQIPGGTTARVTQPVMYTSPNEAISDVSTGSGHTCGVFGARVECFGNLSTPVFDNPSVVAVGSGADHACIVTSGGGVGCWGQNDRGQLATPGGPTATLRIAPLSQIQDVDGGTQHSCALTRMGEVVCWGSNDSGQVDPTQPGSPPEFMPQPVSLPDLAAALSVGEDHACALLDDGSLFCWGDNSHYQLGSGNSSAHRVHHEVTNGQ
ncbi:MAG: hypothetical protein AAGF12_20310 [Myxococcota bacterium]